MKELQAFLAERNNRLDYPNIHQNEEIGKALYAHIKITCPESPFDYIDSVELDEKGRVYARIFIEPVGNLSFKGSSLESFFEKLNTLFNSQPATLGYVEAGHKLAYYASNIRKHFAIDVDFVDTNAIWAIDLEEKEVKEIAVNEIVTGQDLYDYIRQKNRLTVGILDEMMVDYHHVADGMIGEVLTVEEMMPDFFKALIELKPFETYNQRICTLSEKKEMPKNRLVEWYLSYEATIQELEAIEFLQEESLLIFQTQAQHFYEEGRHELEDFSAYKKRTSK